MALAGTKRMSSSAPPPPILPETSRSLLAATRELAELAPWRFATDSQPVGLRDPATGEARIGCIFGRAREVFAAVFYRRRGVAWYLSMLAGDGDSGIKEDGEGFDCLKVGWVTKKELWKEDLAALKEADFKPKGTGHVWPMFRSVGIGWQPWFIDPAEANQLLADLPRLTAFYRLLEKHPDLFAGRSAREIPFVPLALPDRPLEPKDLGWEPMVPAPEPEPFPYLATLDELSALRGLGRLPELELEFAARIVFGASFLEAGRPCLARLALLVERQEGFVVGTVLESAALDPIDMAGRALVELLVKAGVLPGVLLVRNPRYPPAFAELCSPLGIRIRLAKDLPKLEECFAGISQALKSQGK